MPLPRLMVYLVYALIVSTLCVFTFTSSESPFVQTLCNYFPKEAAYFVFGSLIIASTLIFKESGKRLKNKWMFAFLAFSIFQFFLYLYWPLISIFKDGRLSINFWIVRPYINIFTGILLIKVLAENIKNREWVNIFKLLCWCGFLISVYALLQCAGIDWSSKNFERNFVNGFFDRNQAMFTFLSHHTLTAAYVAVIAPLCLMFKQVRYKVFLAVMILTLALIDSILAVASFLVSIFVYLILTKKFKLMVVIATLSILAVLFLGTKHKNFYSFNGRINLWKHSITDVLDNKPFIGFGYGSFSEKYDKAGAKTLFAHNDYVQELNEGGIFGFAIALFWLSSLLWRGLSNIADRGFILDIVLFCAVICLCFLSFGSFIFHYTPLAVIGILYIAYIESQNINYRGNHE